MAQDLLAHSAASAVTEVVPEASARASLGGEARSDQGAPSDGYLQRYAPVGNLFELGAYAGMLFISDENSFRGPAGTSNGATTLRPYAEFKKPAPEFGARVGYFPLSFLGAELEGMIAPAQTESGESSTVLAGRAHLVVQSPFWSVVPFVFGGAGYWAVLAETAGDDSDPGFHFGGGVKVAANDLWSLRVDVRDTITSSRALDPAKNKTERRARRIGASTST